MSSLLETQRAVQQSVLQQDPKLALGLVSSADAAEAGERLDVYIHAYSARLSETLRNDFHGLAAMIGEEAFAELARAYVDAHTSSDFNVRWYGAKFAEHVATSALWRENAAIGEMASLDWTIGLCFDAVEERCVNPAELSAIAPEQWPEIRFRIRRCVHRLRLDWNVGTIRCAIDRGDPIPELRRYSIPQGWIVSRVGTRIFHREVADDEDRALEVIARGGTFADVCAELSREPENGAIAMRVATLLQTWIANGWLAEVLTASSSEALG